MPGDRTGGLYAVEITNKGITGYQHGGTGLIRLAPGILLAFFGGEAAQAAPDLHEKR
jgi:hypothetical protein